MVVRYASAIVVALVACKQNPSKLDHVSDPTGSALDPWSASDLQGRRDAAKPADTSDKASDSGLGGLDLQGVLGRIKDGLDTPGHYEAPKHSKDFDVDKPHFGVIDIHGDIVEREGFSFTGGRGTELRHIANQLRTLAHDVRLRGLVLRVDSLEISLADVDELRAAMLEFRAANKQLFCHTAGASNAMYLVLTACDKIGLAPLGDVAITGPAAMPIHIKPLLDKLAIQADFIHVGAYKGAAEPLTRDAPSKEMEETINAILDRRFQTIVDTIATARKLQLDAVKTLIDTAMFGAEQAKTARLVDEIAPWEAFRDRVAEAWTKLEIDPDDDDDQLAATIKIARFLGAMPPDRPSGDHVAVVYALGGIRDGAGDGVLGARQEIASQTLVAALRALAADSSVKAVVLRIDSGGGSAQASELIWAAIEQLKASKPVIASMSDVAASGGYYIASGATRIFAHADTLTGSIGVVAGRIAPAQALAKLGVRTFPMGRGKHATMMASLAPWTVDDKALIQARMDDVYRTFVARVAAGRNKTVEAILPLAQGRVWTGSKAVALGLVDEIGGLDAAIAEAKRVAKLDPASELEVYPPSPTLRDVVVGIGSVSTPFGLGGATLLSSIRAIDARAAAAAERLLRLVMSFSEATIQTVAILPDLT